MNIIQKISIEKYIGYIFVNSYKAPLRNLDNILNELQHLMINDGWIIIDRLFSVGNSFDRYIEIEIMNNRLVNNSIRIINDEITQSLSKIATQIISEFNILNTNSVISNFEYNLLKKGIEIK